MIRQNFGKELKERVKKEEDLSLIANWAFTLYLDYSVDREFRRMLLLFTRMSDDPQFEYSYEELDRIADDLIAGNLSSGFKIY